MISDYRTVDSLHRHLSYKDIRIMLIAYTNIRSFGGSVSHFPFFDPFSEIFESKSARIDVPMGSIPLSSLQLRFGSSNRLLDFGYRRSKRIMPRVKRTAEFVSTRRFSKRIKKINLDKRFFVGIETSV